MNTTESRFVRIGSEDGVVSIELINSKALNIIGSGAIDELTEAFRAISQDDDVRAVVLRGAGEKAFIGALRAPSLAWRDAGMDSVAAGIYIAWL